MIGKTVYLVKKILNLTLVFGAMMKMNDPIGTKNTKQMHSKTAIIGFILVVLRIPLYHISTIFCWQLGCATNFSKKR